jgi:hypothetical protein
LISFDLVFLLVLSSSSSIYPSYTHYGCPRVCLELVPVYLYRLTHSSLWKKIETDATDNGKEVALTKLADTIFREKGRPLRLAVDALIWVHEFKPTWKKAGQYGMNNAKSATCIET